MSNYGGYQNYGSQGYGGNPQGYGGNPPQGYGSHGYGGAPGGGGFHVGRPQGPPPGADPQLWSWFNAVDKDGSNHISVRELQEALINGDWSPFDLDTVKLLMNIFDVDRSGTIGFNEFAGLWKYIKDWQGVFRHFDKDRSGSIDRKELGEAFNQFGYRLHPKLLELIEFKYDFKGSGAAVAPHGHGHGAQPAGITFDRFVRACVVIKQLTEAFQRMDTQRNGVIQLNYDTFMETVLSLP